MRTSFGVGVLSMLLFAGGSGMADCARAQGAVNIGAGNCAATVAINFSPGVNLTPANQAPTVDAVLTGCAFVNASSASVSIAAPYKFHWAGVLNNFSCVQVSILDQPGGSGTLYWENNQTSTLQFTSLTYQSLTAIAPAQMTFLITDGYQKGASFVVTADMTPTPYAILQCGLSSLTGSTLKVVTGAAPTIVFSNINVGL